MMKRQKRDRLERARARGYQAGVVGKQKKRVRINAWMPVGIGLVVGVTPWKGGAQASS